MKYELNECVKFCLSIFDPCLVFVPTGFILYMKLVNGHMH